MWILALGLVFLGCLRTHASAKESCERQGIATRGIDPQQRSCHVGCLYLPSAQWGPACESSALARVAVIVSCATAAASRRNVSPSHCTPFQVGADGEECRTGLNVVISQPESVSAYFSVVPCFQALRRRTHESWPLSTRGPSSLSLSRLVQGIALFRPRAALF